MVSGVLCQQGEFKPDVAFSKHSFPFVAYHKWMVANKIHNDEFWGAEGEGRGQSLASLLGRKPRETPQGDAVGSIGQCMAVTATLTEKFLIVIIGGADFMKQLLSV